MAATEREGSAPARREPVLACVIAAHTDPTQVRRLVEALHPLPVFLHCDLRTSHNVYDEMIAGLPERCRLLPRIATGWATWASVQVEIDGYRAALENTAATHIAFLTGSDYPLASTRDMVEFLGTYDGTSFARFFPLPYEQWGSSGGYSRLRYRHWHYRKHMIRLPVPRRLPRGVAFAGGSALKIMARKHAQKVVDTVDRHPELIRFWRRSWAPDETFVPSLLSTSGLVPGWQDEHISTDLWWIGWDGLRHKSPPWLGISDLDALLRDRYDPDTGWPRFFARKFSTGYDTEILDAIDERLRREPFAETAGRSHG